MTAAVYIDGLNLYYGLARPLDCKWVDLQTLFERQFTADDVRRVYFFEAMILGPNRPNQDAYVRALESTAKLQVVLGQMKPKRRYCKVRTCYHQGDRFWPDNEEKHTDVSIAITMVDHAHRAAYDKMILVTADTDLVPALAMVKSIRPQTELVLCVPALDRKRIWGTKPLADLADKCTRVDAELFVKSQFQSPFEDSMGRSHVRPASWREAPLTAAADWRRAHPGDFLPILPSWCR